VALLALARLGLRRVEARLAADLQQVGLDRPVQRLVQVAHQQAQTMPEQPSGRLRDAEERGQPRRGHTLVRPEDQPEPLQPDGKRQLGGMQRGAAGHGERRPAGVLATAPAALGVVLPAAPPAVPAAAERANGAVGPDQRLQHVTASILVGEGRGHLIERAQLTQPVGHHPLFPASWFRPSSDGLAIW